MSRQEQNSSPYIRKILGKPPKSLIPRKYSQRSTEKKHVLNITVRSNMEKKFIIFGTFAKLNLE